MGRVPYRRITPSRNSGADGLTDRSYRRGPGGNEDISPGETIIMQCIVSGILMVVVLLVSLVNIPPAAALRDGLRQALSGASNVQELIYDVRLFGEEWLGWNGSPAALEVEGYVPALDAPPVVIPAAPVTPENNLPLTAIEEQTNPQIPGPSAVPGLWD